MTVLARLQDTKEVLAHLREANFAAGEQRDKMAVLQTEAAGQQQQAQLAQQTSAELEAELALQVKQQQHLLDELSQSQVCLLFAYSSLQGPASQRCEVKLGTVSVCMPPQTPETNWIASVVGRCVHCC